MGLADIAVSALKSETVRNAIGNGGKRIFKQSFEDAQKDENGNVLGWLWNEGSKLVGFLLSEASKLISFSLTSIWGWITSTLQYVWNFNFQMTDKQIDEQINARWEALSGMLGGALGNLVGYLGCGVLPGAVMFAFNEPLGAYVLANVGEEMAEEFLGNVTQIVQYSFQAATESLVLWSFKNIRKMIKNNPDLVRWFFGKKTDDIVKAWGKEGSEPWSFALATEKAIEKIPNAAVRNFVEEFLEEAWDGCVEAGYVVANSVDSYLAAEKLKQQEMPVLGQQKYVEVTPNRENPDERIILAGPQEALKPVVVQTLANHQLMAEKDLGTVYCFEPEKVQNRRFKPHVVIWFQETKLDYIARKKTDKEASRGKGRISFRLMDKTTENLSMDYVLQLANKIKAKFGTPPLEWNKGKLLYTYTDYDKGYQLQLLVTSEAEALRIIESVLDIQSHSFDREKAQQSRNLAPEKAYDSTPKKKTILGKQEKQPVKRQNCKVKFLYAQLFIEDKQHPVTLYDKSKRYRSPIVRDTTEAKK